MLLQATFPMTEWERTKWRLLTCECDVSHRRIGDHTTHTLARATTAMKSSLPIGEVIFYIWFGRVHWRVLTSADRIIVVLNCCAIGYRGNGIWVMCDRIKEIEKRLRALFPSRSFPVIYSWLNKEKFLFTLCVKYSCIFPSPKQQLSPSLSNLIAVYYFQKKTKKLAILFMEWYFSTLSAFQSRYNHKLTYLLWTRLGSDHRRWHQNCCPEYLCYSQRVWPMATATKSEQCH